MTLSDDRDPDAPDNGRRFLPSTAGRWVLLGAVVLTLALWGLSWLGGFDG